jgi:hypothetical protein
MTKTSFMSFWQELNDWMIVYGEGEVLCDDARHLFELFGDAESAADHEARIRRLDRQAQLEEA